MDRGRCKWCSCSPKLWSNPPLSHILSLSGRKRAFHDDDHKPVAGVHAPRQRSTMSQIELRPGLADVPVAESAISFIDGKRARLEYRGISVETLARQSCYEESSWLLLKGELPTQRELADFDNQ